MFNLHFPEFDFKVKTEDEKQLIFDKLRKKYVVITPEEWVRQHIVHYLTEVKNYPESFISVEHSIVINNIAKRCDIVVFNKSFQPKLIIECKRPEINLTQNVFDQAGRYNLTLRVPYVAITNGVENIVAHIDLQNGKYNFIDAYPKYKQLE